MTTFWILMCSICDVFNSILLYNISSYSVLFLMLVVLPPPPHYNTLMSACPYTFLVHHLILNVPLGLTWHMLPTPDQHKLLPQKWKHKIE